MEHIDTHDVELAFDELIKELSKLKDLNNLVDAYKENIDSLSARVNALLSMIDDFYRKAQEHNSVVQAQYDSYVKKAEDISLLLDARIKEMKSIEKRNIVFHIALTVLGLILCAGLSYLIFFA